MNGASDSECIEIAQRAEHKANGAYDHALDLHEKLGKLYRLIESVRIQLNTLDSEVRSFSSNFRNKLESVPELVEEAITEHGIKDDAKTWRGIKDFLKTATGKALSKTIEILIIAGIAGTAGYIAHKLGSK